MALTSCLSSEQLLICWAYFPQEFLSVFFFVFFVSGRCSSPPHPSSGVWATEGLPIKMPSGPCWPPDEHMPRMHHACVWGWGGQFSPTYPLLPSATSLYRHFCNAGNSPSHMQTEQSIQWHFFREVDRWGGGVEGFCWQTNLAKDESRPLADSVRIEWETVADGGVGPWINRLVEHLTDEIFRRPRRTRELISLGEHASARFIRLGRKFGSFPGSGGSINQRLQQFGEGTGFCWGILHIRVSDTCVNDNKNFGNTKWERENVKAGEVGGLGDGMWGTKDKEIIRGAWRQLGALIDLFGTLKLWWKLYITAK